MTKFVAVGLIAVALVAFPYGVVAKGGKKGVKKSSGHAAELMQSVNDDGSARGFGWQERARVCAALTEAQCKAVVELQSGGGDGAGGGAAGDGGSAGAAGGDGCGPR